MSDSRTRDLGAYDAEYYVERYRSTRHQPADLFASEKYFLHRCLRPGMTVLDIGCACGGFYNILTTLEPGLHYQGIDISPTLIAEARLTYPNGQFDITDGTALQYASGAFDLVQTWGVMLHEPEYRTLLKEAWRVSRENLLFDVRLQVGHPEIVDRERAFVLNPGGVRNFYIVAEAADFIRTLLQLEPVPSEIEIFGYEGRANRFTTLPAEIGPVYMAGVSVRKGRRPTPVVRLQVPSGLDERLRSAVQGAADVGPLGAEDASAAR